jgi:hypothetical protein
MNIEESELKQLQEQENKKSTIFRELGILETQKAFYPTLIRRGDGTSRNDKRNA